MIRAAAALDQALDDRLGRPADGEAKYLDTTVPRPFPVLLKAGAPAGTHAVKASVTYFYCSKSEGWCRKGTSDVAFDVRVP